jgi:hypothetical protein
MTGVKMHECRDNFTAGNTYWCLSNVSGRYAAELNSGGRFVTDSSGRASETRRRGRHSVNESTGTTGKHQLESQS